MTSNSDDLKAFMRQVPLPVFVITCKSEKGVYAMTASSVNSCSLSPPLLCFNVQEKGRFWSYLKESVFFCVHLLNENQTELSQHFAKGFENQNAVFEKIELHDPFDNEVPVIQACEHVMLCEKRECFSAGDHFLVLGETKKTLIGHQSPLLYYDRAYHLLR